MVGIAAGGMAGAVLRYWIRSMQMGAFPWDTLAVNVGGSFLLALLMTMALGRLKLSAELQSGLTVGFLGAFTTFSAICQEYVSLIGGGQTLLAVAYMAATVATGLAATYAGWLMARRINRRGGTSADAKDEG